VEGDYESNGGALINDKKALDVRKHGAALFGSNIRIYNNTTKNIKFNAIPTPTTKEKQEFAVKLGLQIIGNGGDFEYKNSKSYKDLKITDQKGVVPPTGKGILDTPYIINVEGCIGAYLSFVYEDANESTVPKTVWFVPIRHQAIVNVSDM
jgi:hypothetical protein